MFNHTRKGPEKNRFGEVSERKEEHLADGLLRFGFGDKATESDQARPEDDVPGWGVLLGPEGSLSQLDHLLQGQR